MTVNPPCVFKFSVHEKFESARRASICPYDREIVLRIIIIFTRIHQNWVYIDNKTNRKIPSAYEMECMVLIRNELEIFPSTENTNSSAVKV